MKLFLNIKTGKEDSESDSMFEMIKKLMMAREISFEKGNITLLKQRVVISPAQIFTNVVDEVNNDPGLTYKFYEAAKKVNMKGYADLVSEKYKLRGMKLAEWLINSGEIGGWGEIKFTERDVPKKMFKIRVINSISKDKKSSRPFDHFLRGQIAGGASAAFNIDLDCIETKCMASGNNFCEFVIGSKEFFNSKKDYKLFLDQIQSEK